MTRSFLFIGGPKDGKWVECDDRAPLWKICGPSGDGNYRAFNYLKQQVRTGSKGRDFFFHIEDMSEDEAVGRYLEIR